MLRQEAGKGLFPRMRLGGGSRACEVEGPQASERRRETAGDGAHRGAWAPRTCNPAKMSAHLRGMRVSAHAAHTAAGYAKSSGAAAVSSACGQLLAREPWLLPAPFRTQLALLTPPPCAQSHLMEHFYGLGCAPSNRLESSPCSAQGAGGAFVCRPLRCPGRVTSHAAGSAAGVRAPGRRTLCGADTLGSAARNPPKCLLSVPAL